MNLDRAILEQVIAWGKDIVGFTANHAADGLTCVQGYVQGGTDGSGTFVRGIDIDNREKLCLYAMDLAWTFWMDDVFDTRESDGAPVDLQSIIDATTGPATKPEATGLFQLRTQYERWAKDKPDYEIWLRTAIETVTSWHREAYVSRKDLRMSYAEYVENGISSTAMPHVVATACLLYGFDMSSRTREPRIQRLLRNLAISCRLHNDLVSVEKERVEGCLANAAIMMERFMTPVQSRAFIEDELAGYMKLLDDDITALGDLDPFARMARVMPVAHHVLYTTPRDRYKGSAP